MTQFSGRNVLITGGAGGIGRLMALQIAREGGRTVIWDIDAAHLQKVFAEIKECGAEIHIYRCDVSDRADVYARANEVTQTVGTVDILINNAGVVSGKPFLQCTDEQIEQTMRVNVMGAMWTVRAFLPAMIAANRGHIVNMSSASGIVGVAGLADYAASKFAVFGFDESLRAEMKKKSLKVRTTVVCPHYINTGMFEGARSRFPWLLPILEEKEAARRIIRAIKRNRARLCLPRTVYAIMPLRMLPTAAFDYVMRFLGVHDSMDAFQGRPPPTGD